MAMSYATERGPQFWRTYPLPPILWQMSDVTRLLTELGEGNPRAAEELLPLVYENLRQLAAAKLAREQPGQTLQATALACSRC